MRCGCLNMSVRRCKDSPSNREGYSPSIEDDNKTDTGGNMEGWRNEGTFHRSWSSLVLDAQVLLLGFMKLSSIFYTATKHNTRIPQHIAINIIWKCPKTRITTTLNHENMTHKLFRMIDFSNLESLIH